MEYLSRVTVFICKRLIEQKGPSHLATIIIGYRQPILELPSRESVPFFFFFLHSCR